MKQVLLFIILIVLFGCSSKYEPLNDIDISEYNILHSEENFTIWQLSLLPDMEYSMCDSYKTEQDVSICLRYPGSNAWIVQFNNKFYSLRFGIDESLYTTEDLIEYGVIFAGEIEE